MPKAYISLTRRHMYRCISLVLLCVQVWSNAADNVSQQKILQEAKDNPPKGFYLLTAAKTQDDQYLLIYHNIEDTYGNRKNLFHKKEDLELLQLIIKMGSLDNLKDIPLEWHSIHECFGAFTLSATLKMPVSENPNMVQLKYLCCCDHPRAKLAVLSNKQRLAVEIQNNSWDVPTNIWLTFQSVEEEEP